MHENLGMPNARGETHVANTRADRVNDRSHNHGVMTKAERYAEKMFLNNIASLQLRNILFILKHFGYFCVRCFLCAALV